MNKADKPVFEMQLRQIGISIFKNTSKDGRPYFNTQLIRRYQTSDKEWTNSSSFTGLTDLLPARHLIDEAIAFQRQHDGTESEQ